MLLAAGASVEAKNDNGCGPQRRDGRDRTDVVGRRCHGFQDEVIKLSLLGCTASER